ncbi:VPA1262 family N-terminal domain-containing protein [Chitinophaga nivalis]|uniref:VPA1262 family N-terminal domain-containing protein n=1 Tax=Chitinophaga nivalis TaxID=2991709 RepID=A0ABT3IFC7_9BACT|nr:VPA1262 family N-terminal domain-containing protein [Chitinophaga nivalis]MCW3467653.1 VPA1262 family N-terminal domain-containing protein [Chitinophaga nivalis]MCW3482655.1 VPA1262 family N-terminal domain-containing protein [Chitinophaga nivalis]
MDLLEEIMPFYTKAMRTAIVAEDVVTKKWYHVFSVIELLPEEFLPYKIPDQTWYKYRTIRPKLEGKWDIYKLNLVVEEMADVGKAIEYFKNPLQQGKAVDITDHFINGKFSMEPAGASPLVLPSNIYTTEGVGAILPKRDSGLLVWTQIDTDRVVQQKFQQTTGKEKEIISKLTSEWLGFDLFTFPEHIGNMYLSLPNPYFRKLNFTHQSNPEGIIYNLLLRQGIKNELLSIHITDWHGDEIAFDGTFDINEKIGFLNLPHKPGMIETRVYNKSKHLIAMLPKAAFIHRINFGVSIGHSKLKINREGENPVIIQKYSTEQTVKVGDAEQLNETYYFKTGEKSRQFQRHQRRNEFHFFAAGQTEVDKVETKTKARKIVKEIINQAKDSCYLVDPYFMVNDLIEYAYQIKNISVTLRILNCKGKDFVNKEEAQKLYDAIEEYNKKPYQKIECKMLMGSTLHDRFIITDTNAYFLGTSFAEIGKRAGCIGKIPNSSDLQVVDQVEKWFWKESVTLMEYINSKEL